MDSCIVHDDYCTRLQLWEQNHATVPFKYRSCPGHNSEMAGRYQIAMVSMDHLGNGGHNTWVTLVGDLSNLLNNDRADMELGLAQTTSQDTCNAMTGCRSWYNATKFAAMPRCSQEAKRISDQVLSQQRSILDSAIPCCRASNA